MLVWDEPNYRLTSSVGILGVSGVRLFSVAHHKACESFLIGLYLEVARARHVHLFPVPHLFGRSRITDSSHWL
jgi:hypothetical protein